MAEYYDAQNSPAVPMSEQPAFYGSQKYVGPKVTSFTELKTYAGGQVVELPPFAEGQPLIARLRRPSLLAMMKTGQIPNQLLATASELFSGGGSAIDPDDIEAVKQLFDIIDVIVKASLIEPTYDEIKEAGLELSDDQLMFIFNYSQSGVAALKSFRQE